MFEPDRAAGEVRVLNTEAAEGVKGRRIRALALWLTLMQQRPVSRNYS